VNRKSTIQHKEVNKINSLVTPIKNKYMKSSDAKAKLLNLNIQT